MARGTRGEVRALPDYLVVGATSSARSRRARERQPGARNDEVLSAGVAVRAQDRRRHPRGSQPPGRIRRGPL